MSINKKTNAVLMFATQDSLIFNSFESARGLLSKPCAEAETLGFFEAVSLRHAGSFSA